MQRLISTALLAACLAFPAASWAQSTAPAAEEVRKQAMAAKAAGDMSSAFKLAKQVTELDPREPRYLLELAVFAHDAGEREAGIAALDAYLKRVPERATDTRLDELRRSLEALPARPAGPVPVPSAPRRPTPEQVMAAETLRLTLADAAKAAGAGDRPQRRKHLVEALRQCQQLMSDLDCVDPKVARAGAAIAEELDLEQLAFDSYVLLAFLGQPVASDNETLTLTAGLRRRLKELGQLDAAERQAAARAIAVTQKADLLARLAANPDVGTNDRGYFQAILSTWPGRMSAYRQLIRDRLVATLQGSPPQDAGMRGGERIMRLTLSRAIPENVLFDQVIAAAMTSNPEAAANLLNEVAETALRTAAKASYAELLAKAIAASVAVDNNRERYSVTETLGMRFGKLIDSKAAAQATRELVTLAPELGEDTYPKASDALAGLARRLSEMSDAQATRETLLKYWNIVRNKSQNSLDLSGPLDLALELKQPLTAIEMLRSLDQKTREEILGGALAQKIGEKGYGSMANEFAALLRPAPAADRKADVLLGDLSAKARRGDLPGAELTYRQLLTHMEDDAREYIRTADDKAFARGLAEAEIRYKRGDAAFKVAVCAIVAGNRASFGKYMDVVRADYRPPAEGPRDASVFERHARQEANGLLVAVNIDRGDLPGAMAALDAFLRLEDRSVVEVNQPFSFFNLMKLAVSKGQLETVSRLASIYREREGFDYSFYEEIDECHRRRLSSTLLFLCRLGTGKLHLARETIPVFAYLGDRSSVTELLAKLDGPDQTKWRNTTDAILSDDFSETLVAADDKATNTGRVWLELYQYAAERRWWRQSN